LKETTPQCAWAAGRYRIHGKHVGGPTRHRSTEAGMTLSLSLFFCYIPLHTPPPSFQPATTRHTHILLVWYIRPATPTPLSQRAHSPVLLSCAAIHPCLYGMGSLSAQLPSFCMCVCSRHTREQEEEKSLVLSPRRGKEGKDFPWVARLSLSLSRHIPIIHPQSTHTHTTSHTYVCVSVCVCVCVLLFSRVVLPHHTHTPQQGGV
jgi:hypothetical protein